MRIHRLFPTWTGLVVACTSMTTTIHAFSFHPSSSRSSLTKLPSSRSLPFQQKRQKQHYPSSTRSSQSLSMHMGHSHTHNHHHEEQVVQAPPKTMGGHVLRFSQRPVVRLVFAALVVFVPALVRRRQFLLKRPDFAAFFLISAGLTFADGARREVQRVTNRVMDWRHGILKHAPKEKSGNFVEKLFSKKREQAADRVTLLGVLVNLVLSVGKLAVGITCHSSALVADAGHSMSDLFSDFVTLWAVQIARLPPDDDHPYGHGKFEAVGALFLALTLLGTGLSVGAVSYGNLKDIIKLGNGNGGAAAVAAAVQVPTFPALIMAFTSIVSKEWLYRITRRVGEDLNSQVVLANAWHHRSDAYSSILALVSIALAMSVPGLLAADSAAGLLVGGMICMTGAEIMGEAVKQLTDASADEDLVKNVRDLALQESDDVLAVTGIRTRQMGSKAFVDVYISTPESLSNSATRAVEERVKYTILKNDPNIVDADVHAKSGIAEAMSLATDTQDYESHSHSHSHGSEGSPGSADHAHEEAELTNALKSEQQAQQQESEIATIAVPSSADEMVGPFEPVPTVAISSFQEVEDDARKLLDGHEAIKSIEGCTVHYDETSQEVQVDITIKLENPDWTTVTFATTLARELKTVLEEGSANIHTANIFLDLNNAPAAETVNGSLPGNSTVVASASS